MKPQQRFYDIDLLRFLAAVSVLFFHYVFCGFGEGVSPVVSFGNVAQYFKYGYLGVELFFIISGFVILLSAAKKSARAFVISRIVRLYPIYWICVSLTALTVFLFGQNLFSVNGFEYLTNLTMFHGYFGIDHVDGVYWTLLVELRFYILILIILLFKGIDQIKPILAGWLILTYIITYTGAPTVIHFLLIPGNAVYFIAGAIFYLIKKEGLSFYKLSVLIGSYYLAIKKAYWNIPTMNERYATEFSPLMVVGIITLLFFIMFLVSIGKTQFANKKFMVKLGALTYPLYLVHGRIGSIIANHTKDMVDKYVLFIILTAFMVGISILINKWVDQYATINFKVGLEKLFKVSKNKV